MLTDTPEAAPSEITDPKAGTLPPVLTELPKSVDDSQSSSGMIRMSMLVAETMCTNSWQWFVLFLSAVSRMHHEPAGGVFALVVAQSFSVLMSTNFAVGVGVSRRLPSSHSITVHSEPVEPPTLACSPVSHRQFW